MLNAKISEVFQLRGSPTKTTTTATTVVAAVGDPLHLTKYTALSPVHIYPSLPPVTPRLFPSTCELLTDPRLEPATILHRTCCPRVIIVRPRRYRGLLAVVARDSSLEFISTAGERELRTYSKQQMKRSRVAVARSSGRWIEFHELRELAEPAVPAPHPANFGGPPRVLNYITRR